MLKSLHEKYGVLNEQVSGAELYDALSTQIPAADFQEQDYVQCLQHHNPLWPCHAHGEPEIVVWRNV